MYKSAIAGVFLCVLVMSVTSSPSVSAEALNLEKITETITESKQPLAVVLEVSSESDKNAEVVETKQPQVVSHVVEPGESLEKIATAHQTTWKRLFDKNTAVADPDIITAGQVIVVPDAAEVLAERPLPQPVPEPVTPASVASTTQSRARASATAGVTTSYAYTAPRGSSAGNRYTPGYCTWYVKNMRPDLPNNLGNANTWVARAAAQGLPTGSTPQVGAVGQRGMHVVYVESVNPDGTVTISEMNWGGLYKRNVRTVPAGHFTYIY